MAISILLENSALKMTKLCQYQMWQPLILAICKPKGIDGLSGSSGHWTIIKGLEETILEKISFAIKGRSEHSINISWDTLPIGNISRITWIYGFGKFVVSEKKICRYTNYILLLKMTILSRKKNQAHVIRRALVYKHFFKDETYLQYRFW